MFAPEFAPFTVALIVMLAIGAIELVSLLVGFSPSASLESALPDIPELDAPELSGAELGPFSAILSWLSVGRVPILVLFVVFLTAFALGGYAAQAIMTAVFGGPADAWLAAIPALVVGAYATRHLGRWLGRIIPRDHNEAASQQDLVGSYATVLRGEARRGHPAEAKTRDLRGRTHYVLLEPREAEDAYAAGQRVFIVGRQGHVYRATTKVETKES